MTNTRLIYINKKFFIVLNQYVKGIISLIAIKITMSNRFILMQEANGLFFFDIKTEANLTFLQPPKS